MTQNSPGTQNNLHPGPSTERYNILLQLKGETISFEFPPATAAAIARIGYIIPTDARCRIGLVDESTIHSALAPVLGATPTQLDYLTRKQVTITLHGTAILGYQRFDITDPRISNKVATLYEVYVDNRIFPQSSEPDWQYLMGELVSREEDAQLTEDIKNRLIEQAQERSN